MEQQKYNTLVVARSWRVFGKQQFVAIKELCDKLSKLIRLEFHININEETDEILLKILTNYVNRRGCSLKIYKDLFFDEYAESKGIDSRKIEQFKEWKWIYHLLLYQFLYEKQGVDYLLSYDDDILFNDQNIADVEHYVLRKIPFAIADQYVDGDKCMMGKLCVHFGAWINDEYYSNFGNEFSSNSGFLGINNDIFKHFTSAEDFGKMIDMFEYKKWDHLTMQGSGYESYKILLQEQSFLGILNKAFSNRNHIVLHEKDGYLISSNLKKTQSSRVEHYIGILKYTAVYLDEIEKRFERYYNEIK